MSQTSVPKKRWQVVGLFVWERTTCPLVNSSSPQLELDHPIDQWAAECAALVNLCATLIFVCHTCFCVPHLHIDNLAHFILVCLCAKLILCPTNWLLQESTLSTSVANSIGSSVAPSCTQLCGAVWYLLYAGGRDWEEINQRGCWTRALLPHQSHLTKLFYSTTATTLPCSLPCLLAAFTCTTLPHTPPLSYYASV